MNQNNQINNRNSDTQSLVVEHLTVAYDSKPVLKDVTFFLPKGQLVAFIGPNGAGKTTLIKALLGLLKPISGEISFPSLEKKEISKKIAIAYVPQSSSVDWDFPTTVFDVVMMGCYGRLGYLKRPGKKEKSLVVEMLKKVSMEEFSHIPINKLSGGQQQRVFLARAFMQEAEFYFMDEPFKGVDAQSEQTTIALLKNLTKEGKTVVVVHHDLHTVPSYFQWVTLINGRIFANGPAEKVFTAENIRNTFNHSYSQSFHL